MASCGNFLRVLRSLGVIGLCVLAGICLFRTSAFADACSDLTSQYNAAVRAYQSNNFQFPQDCGRAHDYFRTKREQAQSLVSIFRDAKQSCGQQFNKDGRAPPEYLVSLLEHEAVTLETGCNVLAGAPATAPAPQPPPPAVAAAPAPPPLPAQAAAPVPSPPPPSQTVAPAPPPAQAPALPPNQAAAPPSNQAAAQSCAAQKTMPPAPGCNADFPQLLTGAVCTAADNSVGLTLQVPGSEPTCCVTSCGRSR